ncbi:hypothetical protein [Micromonospora sp.]|uniref:hypothetical protein n=1 Tax=unclassified Micromonospora TaxID=2617518 RepID=UPI003B3A6422
MRTNEDGFTVNVKAKSGASIKGVVPPGFAELTDSGIVTSFTLLADGYPLGRHFALDKKHNAREERVRGILAHLASAGLAVAANGVLYRRTGQRLNMPTMFVFKGISKRLISLLPHVTDAELGYYDHTGQIVIEGTIRLS